MPNVKKAYTAIIQLLQDNQQELVESILPQALELASSKSGSGGGKPSVFHMLEDGTVAAIRCYYHKLWMDPRVVEFGKKANSATGLNTMCKDGANKWSKQQREAKTAEANILTQLQDGELAIDDIPTAQAEIAEEQSKIVPREDGYGFETLEECLADSAERGLEVGDFEATAEEAEAA